MHVRVRAALTTAAAAARRSRAAASPGGGRATRPPSRRVRRASGGTAAAPSSSPPTSPSTCPRSWCRPFEEETGYTARGPRRRRRRHAGDQAQPDRRQPDRRRRLRHRQHLRLAPAGRGRLRRRHAVDDAAGGVRPRRRRRPPRPDRLGQRVRQRRHRLVRRSEGLEPPTDARRPHRPGVRRPAASRPAPRRAAPAWRSSSPPSPSYGDDWEDYWTDLLANGAKVVDGWEDAYYGDFTAGSETGTRPIVVSYDSSPAFTVDGREDHHRGAARHLLPPGGVRRRARRRRQPRGCRGAGRLAAQRRGAERAAGVDVRLPGHAGRDGPRRLGASSPSSRPTPTRSTRPRSPPTASSG